MSAKLAFGKGRGNSKLKRWNRMYTFALRAGHDCPFAKKCKSMVVVGNDGRASIRDGKDIEFRCLGASSEVRSKNLRLQSARNSELIKETGLKDRKALTTLIDRSIPEGAEIVRVHATGGDFMSLEYMQAWMDVAALYPETLFYGYTKALPYYVETRLDTPDNFRFTPSRGGRRDDLIDEHGLIEARVVFHPDEAKKLGWPIDHDDTHAMAADHSFCLLIHGVQPKGSRAAAALAFMRKHGIKFGYSRKQEE